MYCGRLPPGIQFETSWREVMVTPRKGKMFGCVKRFQITASWQNICEFCEWWQSGGGCYNVKDALWSPFLNCPRDTPANVWRKPLNHRGSRGKHHRNPPRQTGWVQHLEDERKLCTMLGVSLCCRIYFSVRVDTSGRWDWKDRDH